MSTNHFSEGFKLITGHAHLPWQQRLYDLFVSDQNNDLPTNISIPTGLGKTSVVAVWLMALMKRPDRVPRRLVYVVNRRTVVDQTTSEAEQLRANIAKIKPPFGSLAISTLRGQFADNHEWSADPSRPAVVCGTVDMIGSRLLFSGYRIGFKSRPLHAGFLGQDVLLVHDEAHLEPAFQRLIEKIEQEQRENEKTGELPWPKLQIMALSATSRTASQKNGEAFVLNDSDKEHEVVKKRICAPKSLHMHECEDEKQQLVDQIVELALEHKDSGSAVVIFARHVDDVESIAESLYRKHGVPSECVKTLTGTMRGYERDRLVEKETFKRFLPESCGKKFSNTVYLVCTSAGEVGVNLSADHMVCDLTTMDSMIQRLGRVNRFGERDDTQVDVVYPAGFDKNEASGKVNAHRQETLKHLGRLPSLGENQFDASPKAIGDVMHSLTKEQRKATFAPEPTILPATDILLDAWALTTIRNKMPGRPPVAPYLHGVAEWEPPRTSVAWRQEVEVINDELIAREGRDFPQELLADYPLKPHELLSDRTDRVLESLQKLAADHADSPVWLVDDQQQVCVLTLGKIANPAAKKAQDKSLLERAIAESIVLLPQSVGGLSDGMLDPKSQRADDVANHWLDENNWPRRQRGFSDDARPTDGPDGMALARTIDTDPWADELALPDEGSELDIEAETEPGVGDEGTLKRGRFWHWYARPRDAEDATLASAEPIAWDHHTRDVIEKAKQIVNDLKLPDNLKEAVILAAELHDLGKQREIWQRSIGNPNPTNWYAKPGKPAVGRRWKPRHFTDYRHEFGTLLDMLDANQGHATRLTELSDEMQDIVLHLIAAHHGYARLHFPPDTYDHERYDTQQNQRVAHEVMRRYARLQRRYGRWGLAYLESLLRAADWVASANPSENTPDGGGAS